MKTAHEAVYLTNDTFTLSSQWIAIPGLGRFILDQRQQPSDRGKLQRQLSKKQKTNDPETRRTIFSHNYEKQRLKVVCNPGPLRQLHAESWPSWAVATTDDVKAPVEPM